MNLLCVCVRVRESEPRTNPDTARARSLIGLGQQQPPVGPGVAGGLPPRSTDQKHVVSAIELRIDAAEEAIAAAAQTHAAAEHAAALAAANARAPELAAAFEAEIVKQRERTLRCSIHLRGAKSFLQLRCWPACAWGT